MRPIEICTADRFVLEFAQILKWQYINSAQKVVLVRAHFAENVFSYCLLIFRFLKILLVLICFGHLVTILYNMLCTMLCLWNRHLMMNEHGFQMFNMYSWNSAAYFSKLRLLYGDTCALVQSMDKGWPSFFVSVLNCNLLCVLALSVWDRWDVCLFANLFLTNAVSFLYYQLMNTDYRMIKRDLQWWTIYFDIDLQPYTTKY